MESMTHAAATARQGGGKRFVRPDELPAFSLTPRSLRLLAHVARHKLIASDDLAALDGGSVQNAKRELRTLWAHGYLMRPEAQLWSVAITGPQPMVYGLTNKGARLLHSHGHRIDLDIDWSENCRRSGVAFIDHAVARSRLMSGVEVAVRGLDDVDLLHAHEVIALAPPATRKARQPLKWEAKVSDNGKMVPASVIADDLFALRFANETESYFLVEIDRGQMPVRRHTNAEEEVGGKRRLRTHYKHKLATYWHGWKQGRPLQQFGVEQLRVLTVTTSVERIRTMLDALREVTGGKGSELFLFIEEEALRKANPLEALWITGKGRECRLTE
ncbi:replication-relaxation family protein [Methylocystis sp.]|uniref:replication-relaxation family protein n=1 Tax=Methylocystis sp. TaxID=1911079 RepID=UPI0025CFD456|nr:replication-relaxation family protein [Methylocystis sp.]